MRLLVTLKAGDTESWRDEAAVTVTEAMAVFEAAGEHAGLAKAWRLLAWMHGTACHFGLAAEASVRALHHAEIAGDVRQQTRAATAYAAAAVFGPTPIAEAIERCESTVPQVTGDRQSEATLLALLAGLLAMQGSFERAREHSARARGILQELGLEVALARMSVEFWRVEMLAGDTRAAERELERAQEQLEKMGEKYLLSTVSGLLAQTRYALGLFDEVEALARLAQELASADDVDTQSLWRSALGKVLARNGAFDEGEALVREALRVLADTDAIVFRCEALLDLAEVQRLAGRDFEATLAEARELAQAKGSPVLIEAVDRSLSVPARAAGSA